MTLATSLDKSPTNSDASSEAQQNLAFVPPADKSVTNSEGSKKRPKQPRPPHIRPEDDFFETPAWVTHAILEHLPAGEICDPCAGAGAIVAACLAAGRKAKGTEFDGPRALAAKHRGLPISAGDGLALLAVAPVPLIVMNPPFQAAETWVRAAVAPGRTVAALLRLAFLESSARVKLFAKLGMPDVHVLARRPSFTKNARTEKGAAYAWMIWGPGRGGRISRLDSTARKERAK